jgi:hypothetical protein
MSEIIKEMPFGTIILREDSIGIIESPEGINIDSNMAHAAINLMESTFQGNYGFISNNIHPYSIDVEVYKIFSQSQRLACVAIVSYKQTSNKIYLSYEKMVIEKPNNLFHGLAEAITWAKSFLE